MKKLLFILGIVVHWSISVQAQDVQQNNQQQAQSQQQVTGEQGGQVLDLTLEAIRIEKRIEMPRVRIFDKRIPPKFDEISMERSFLNELIGKNEEIRVLVSKKMKVKPIENAQKILQKKR
jgi:hypothetical protein